MTDTPVYLRTPRPVSNSEVGLFKECRRRWWLSQYRGLQPLSQGPSGAAFLGDRIHKWLAFYYDPTVPAVVTAEDVLREWDDESLRLYAEWPQTLTLQSDAELGRIMLEGYFEWLAETGEDSDLEITGAERQVEIEVPNYIGPRPIKLVAKLDVQARRISTGARLFVDHKSVGNLKDLPKGADIVEQFKHYSLVDLLEHLAEGADAEASFVDGGMYNMLRKVKRTASANPPFYGRHDVRHNLHQLRTYWTRLLGEVSEMQRVEDMLMAGADHHAIVPPTPTRDCDWKCEFRAVCPMLDDPTARAEDFLAEVYTIGDPYDRYEPRTPAA